MAHYAIVCTNDAGGFLPICTVGRELQARGHQVTVLAWQRCAPLAEMAGLPFHALSPETTLRPMDVAQWLAFTACGARWIADLRIWMRRYIEATLRKLPSALAEIGVDGVVSHQNVVAGGTAAERLGVPFVSVCSSLPWREDIAVPPPFTRWLPSEGRCARLRNRLAYAGWRWFNRPALTTINRYRRAWGLPRFRRLDDAFSPLAQISQMCPEFDFPRRVLPPHFHYIGSLGTTRRQATADQFPWHRLDGRRLVFASLGTIHDSGNARVCRRILAACAGLDVQLVLALGKWSEEHQSVRERLGPIPENALVVDFAPQLALLDRAALLITHAGVNTVLEAICRGVPMVALPRAVDQLGMGARVAFSGAGLRASFRRGTPEELRGLVERVMAEEAFRRRARELQHAMLAAGGAERAAEIAEEALTTRRPVLCRPPTPVLRQPAWSAVE